jgi:hydroxymethylbilane synthase
MNKVIRIGTRESQLAVWQAELVQQLLAKHNVTAELVFIKSEGDIDLQTPLYEIGVQGIFTRSLDMALINNKIDIAVHSMKDVPTQLANGIVQAAVLQRASYKDIFVYKEGQDDILQQLGYVNGQWSMVNNTLLTTHHSPLTIATSSIRRMAQWLHRYPNTTIENLRGNVNTRLRKVSENNWNGAIFAAAGLERINLRPQNAIDLDWMLPAPAQGAIMVVCRSADNFCIETCATLNDADTATCTKIERDFLRDLLGGCSTPISALAEIKDNKIYFKGNILTPDGKQNVDIEKTIDKDQFNNAGKIFAEEILNKGGDKIIQQLNNAK